MKSMKSAHEVLGQAVLGLAFIHAAAALWHHYVRKDDVLTRMLPKRGSPAKPSSTPAKATPPSRSSCLRRASSSPIRYFVESPPWNSSSTSTQRARIRAFELHTLRAGFLEQPRLAPTMPRW